MNIKDNVVRFYVQNFIINRSQNIEVPGFIFFKLSGKTPIFARQVVIPEDFFINLEKKISEKGEMAQQELYSAGKKFGYSFSLLGGFSNINDKKGQDLVNYINVINKFIEGTYALKVECNIDTVTKICNYSMEDPIVVSKLGYGYFLPLGAAAGLLSYIFQDSTIEGLLEKFDLATKKGDLLYAPAEHLKKENRLFFTETNLQDLEPTPEYLSFNQIRPLKYSRYSFEMLLDSKFFSFNKGVIMNNNERYFILEVSSLYIIEKELKEYSKEIYESAFKTGYMMLNGIQNASIETITDYASAFGWGDTVILKKKGGYVVNVDYFPYTKFYDEINYVIFSGFLAGMLSTVTNENIQFNKTTKTLSNGYLSVSLFS